MFANAKSISVARIAMKSFLINLRFIMRGWKLLLVIILFIFPFFSLFTGTDASFWTFTTAYYGICMMGLCYHKMQTILYLLPISKENRFFYYIWYYVWELLFIYLTLACGGVVPALFGKIRYFDWLLILLKVLPIEIAYLSLMFIVPRKESEKLRNSSVSEKVSKKEFIIESACNLYSLLCFMISYLFICFINLRYYQWNLLFWLLALISLAVQFSIKYRSMQRGE